MKVKYSTDLFTIADCTASIGGNSMSFIRNFNHTISVELDRSMASLLKKNLDLVRNKLNLSSTYEVISGSFLNKKTLKYIQTKAQVLFFDPHWFKWCKCIVDYKREMSADEINCISF